MNLKIHRNLDALNTPIQLTYFKSEYLATQQFEQLLVFESDHILLHVNIENRVALSLPKSPFGSFYSETSITKDAFIQFNELIKDELTAEEVKEIQIVHPSEIYNHFVDKDHIIKAGYSELYNDLNQHIELSENWEDHIHKMQQRKLISLQNEGFEFKAMGKEDLKVAHQFLTVCRQAQGLQINISWDHLEKLTKNLPDAYDCFGVFRDGKISAVCISVKVTEDVAYYYLPGTSPMFRSHSPMVLLIAGMVNHYRERRFKYLDLGISSLMGKVQEPLRVFKERMGAVETRKPTFLMSL